MFKTQKNSVWRGFEYWKVRQPIGDARKLAKILENQFCEFRVFIFANFVVSDIASAVCHIECESSAMDALENILGVLSEGRLCSNPTEVGLLSRYLFILKIHSTAHLDFFFFLFLVSMFWQECFEERALDDLVLEYGSLYQFTHDARFEAVFSCLLTERLMNRFVFECSSSGCWLFQNSK